MDEVKRTFLPLAKIKANQQNPRVISESKLKKLINSLLVFPKMMSLRPITIDDPLYQGEEITMLLIPMLVNE